MCQAIEQIISLWYDLIISFLLFSKCSCPIDHKANMTPAALLQSSLEDLNLSDIPSFKGTSGASILTPEQHLEYSTTPEEHILVHRLTPIFRELFAGNGLQVVNSESLGWLVDMKPDLFLSLPWAYTKKDPSPFHLELLEQYPGNYVYGAIGNKRLFDSVHILDCKVKGNHQTIGEVLQHLQTLNKHSLADQQTSRGMLFCSKGCYLLVCSDLSLESIEFVDWTTPGSRDHLLEFFHPFSWNINPFLNYFGVKVSGA